MGHGRIKQKNKLKKAYLSQAVKYIEQLEKENDALKNDPNGVVGQFLGQYRELYSQNGRLSVLAACLIKKLGDNVELTKEEMESFKDNQITIKWELPEGVEKHEDAKSYVFTYELAPAQKPQAEIVPIGNNAAETPAAQPESAETANENVFEEAVAAEANEDVVLEDFTTLDETEVTSEAIE